MLILSRQVGETIMIGDDIEISLQDLRGDKARIGISAPKAIAVHRKEVFQAIQREGLALRERENAAAAQIKPEQISELVTASGKRAGGEPPA